ncbi:ATP-dependent RNA helicase HrpA [Isoptericola halotolerans]|uniref:ATP-dependent helicase HrpA n=1 Tax=Isoptericola halotolerans TaxID=300560 RepID=A0ABX2A6Z2_9MICO|nr:ATP-dependent helicase HrpA [Isoptericola halotolerans]
MSTETSSTPQPADDGGARGDRRDRRGGEQHAGKDGARRRRGRGGGGKSSQSRNGRGPARVSRDQLDRAAAARAAVVVPDITYPEQLPVSARREDIAAAIEKHQVVVVAGETGSGKTTQLPKILLDLGRGRAGQIGHTQPRRIAARSVAERVAEELGTELGGVVGYQVRFTDTSSADTLVKVMTDGILLAQIQRDPELLAYDTIIIDEAHERSLNIDFLLGYLSRLLPRRPDLKLIVTSATIDSERFAAHFSPAHLAEVGGAPAAVVDVLPDHAPVIEVTGRTYPVEIRYRPLSPDSDPDAPAKKKGEEKDLVTGIVEACDELMREGPGDILVFLSGEREIHDAADALEGHLKERARDPKHPQHVEILPLYSRLSAAEQHRVFQQHSSRRIVLSTNVAETSLTVPGIHYVVDPGTARISRYSKATKVQRLPIEPVSQASANQRSGRSGRVADGVAIRLYAEDDFESRPEFTEPEILRTSLASVLLQMISVGVVETPDDVAKFPFVEPPDTRAVRDGVQLLTELGALARPQRDGSATQTRLTDVGRTLAQLPMDPRLARMIIEGSRRGVAREVSIIAAALSIQDPRERPAEAREQADQQHARFRDPSSDFLAYLNLWEYLREQQHAMGSSAFRRLCKSEYINFLRVREWQDVVAQIRQMGKPLGIDLSYQPTTGGPSAAGSGAPPSSRSGGPPGARERGSAPDPAADDHRQEWDGDTIHRSLLAGLLSQLGMQETNEVKASSVAHLRGEARARALRQAAKRARNEYLGARGARFAIFPGSPLSKKPPAWIMAGELVETSRLWARDVARIQPEWAEELAGGLARRTYADPHWSTKQGAAMATEKVLLYGVPIVADRPVLFAKVDPEAAREMFVRHALVEGKWTTHHRFFAENRRLLAEAEELEARSRQRGLMASEDDLFAFYDERVPASVVSARHFDTWWKKAQHDDPDLLTLTLDQLVDSADTAALPEMFPETWTQGEITLPLTYQFQPGTDADGVTVHVPLSILNRVSPSGFDWMVPGLLDELCVATIRSLPKTVRRELVPAPDVGAAVARWLRENTPQWSDMARAGDMASPFHVEFSRAVRELRDVVIPDEVWDAERVERLPAHLRMTFRVEEPSGAGASGAPDAPGDGRGRKGSKKKRSTRPAPVPLDESKDLLSLQKRLAPQAEAAVRAAVKGAVGVALEEAARAASGSGPGSGPSGAQVGAPPRSRAPGGPPLRLDGGTPTSVPDGGASGAAGASTDAGVASSGSGAVVAEESGLTGWPASLVGGVLPRVVSTDLGGGVVVQGYPALVEEPGAKGAPSVALRVLADAAAQDATHEAGVRRLLLSETALATPRITSRWTSKQSLTLAAAPYRNTEALVADLQLAAVVALTSPDGDKAPGTPTGGPVAVQVRDAESYKEAVAFVRQHLEDEVHRVVGHVVAALSAWRTVENEVRSSSSLALLNTLQDIRDHVAGLIHTGFVSATPPRRVPHLVRYLRAASYRLEKAQSNPHRDAELAWKVHDVADAYERARTAYASGAADPARAAELAEVRWLLEELRVSLFAQQLGTDGAVSEKRIRKILTPGGW